jgi:NAD(P)-dependent dehydrogenase (short-subunit alcohol dehydrogenase family)
MPHIKKIAITGHTRGIGKELYQRLSDRGFELKGFSQSNGYNLQRVSTCKKVVNEVLEWNADVFVNNAYVPDNQVRLLYLMYEQWQNKPRLIINLSATSSDSITNFSQMGYNENWTPYVSDKARLDWASLQLANMFKQGKCRVSLVKPGFVDTDSTAMFKDFAEDYMMTADSVAEQLEWLIDQKNNVQVRNISFDVGNI